SCSRQMVARSLLDTLKEVSDDERDCIAVLERVSRLADDSEPTVRAELMEQVPHIAMFCQENRPSIPYAFSKYLLPIVVRYLADQNNQVRKTSQAALLVLLEQELIERYDVEAKVCPVLVELTAPDSNDDVKTEAVAIMCKMASMVGKDITERLILPRFCEMCCDCRMFHVRKVCAANFGDICSVVGQQATEEMLLPRFFQLCSDNVWGVRKACAECFMAVSCATSQEVRRTKLSTLFINLISDPSRWVRQAAFQSLGPFISTFANPSSSGQFFKEEECKNTEDRNLAEEHSNFMLVHSLPETMFHCTSSSESCQEAANKNEQSFDCCSIAVLPAPAPSSQEKPLSDQELYNSFNFWRTPLPKIDIDLELQETAETLDSETQEGEQEVVASGVEQVFDLLAPFLTCTAQVEVLSAALRASSLDPQEETTAGIGKSVDSQNELSIKDHLSFTSIQDDPVPLINDTAELNVRKQDIVPQALLDQYLSMTDPSRAQTVDTEIAKHCAYSLPGVALTLGRQNWHCLKDTYETLASDMQWKVRRTLAFSIHELAVILGDQLTAGDLVPVFNGFLKDLDEVRIGVLKHLHDFLKLLHPDKRREYLYQLQEFLVTDNSRNWRFRAELAEQLILLLDLYSARDIYDYLRPIALSLCADKVSSVRWISFKLVSEMVKKLYSAPPPTFVVDLMNELVETFCRCQKWSGRQTFAFICQTIIEDDCLPMDQFAEHLLPHLLLLASDRVPNVRVLLAKTLRQTLLEKEYFLTCVSAHQEAVEQTIVALQMDNDNDVKYFASIHPASTKIADDAMSTASSTY
uniref:Serine/threonine-protein phosphatase 4 regulatory subunit 1 n=1 Tax=Podarcis muralis TaxID=64176 RepID=A0A670IG84_PODMU